MVDDDPASAELIRYLLGGRGHRVVVAGLGSEALGAAQRQPPDIVLTDLHLPDMDGFQLLARLRQAGVGAPMLAVTGSAGPGDRERVLHAGFDAYLSKPIDPAGFVGRVESYLSAAVPAQPPEPTPGEPRNPPVPGTALGTVVLALHQEPLRSDLQRLLEASGYRTVTADPATAPEIARRNLPALVLLDPGGPGAGVGGVVDDLRRGQVATLAVAFVSATLPGDGDPPLYGVSLPVPAAELVTRIGALVPRPARTQPVVRIEAATPPVPPTARSGPDRRQSILREIWDQSRELIAQRMATLERAALAGIEDRLDGALRAEARGEAHKLAGTLGTFGLPEGSRLGRELEALLEGSRHLTQEEVLTLSQRVVALTREIERGPAPAAATRTQAAASPGPLVLIVEPDADLRRRLVEEATSWGLRAVAVERGAAAAEALAGERPALVLLDPAAGDAQATLGDAAGSGGATAPPVVLFASPGGPVDRAAAAGQAQGYLEKPMPPSVAMEVVARTLDRLASAATLLVVDDDPLVPGILRGALPGAYRVEWVGDPRRFWAVLEAVSPDLVVMDLDMPYLDGLQLCRMMRNDPVWSPLPVVFLTGRASAEIAREIFAAGADDHIVKPVVAEEFAGRVANRLHRTRLQHELSDRDAPTGIASWAAFRAEAERLIAIARRDAKPVTLALVDLGAQPEGEGPRPGETARRELARVLRRVFADGGALGIDGQRRLVMAIHGARAAEVADRLAAVVDNLRPEDFSPDRGIPVVSAGLAEFPGDGQAVAVLADAAVAALGRATAQGGSCIALASTRSPGAGRTDVLVIDDDDALTGLILHALHTRGYRARQIRDGNEAAALLDQEEGLAARVVLLDVGLPGLDGLSLLRRMVDRGALGYSRVIMMTFRAGEQEVLEALSLGAFDYVAKPVSIPILLYRIRRALDSLAP